VARSEYRQEEMQAGFFLHFDDFSEGQNDHSLERFNCVKPTAARNESQQHAEEEIEPVEEATFTLSKLSSSRGILQFHWLFL